MMKIKFLLLSVFGFILLISLDAQISNPILPGFYPDPSILKVESDYYLVNSSFSYFPGVPIFHSTDLIHWKQIGNILDRSSQLNITNQRISRGIFAPAINFHDGLFYMITTFIDGKNNFFVTAEDPAGPWSDPIYLQEIDGIDPSFFFDENGRAYILNNGPPPQNKPLYDGHRAIWLQEFDLKTNKGIGSRKIIVNGGIDLSQKPVWIEGPHIYQQKGFYYLMAAEGGTSTWHSEVILRSKNIWGPYEVFEGNPILTQRDLSPDRPNPITSAGHADLVQTPDGGWAAVFLACRPYSGSYYNIGRETYMLPVDWSGDWPIILEKGKEIPLEVNVSWSSTDSEPTFADYSADWNDDFENEELGIDWVFMRTPQEKWYTITNGALRIDARPVKMNDLKNPSFIGRRLQHLNAEFSTAVSLEKGKEMEAGIIAFQGDQNYYEYLVVQEDNSNSIVIRNSTEEIASISIKKQKEGKPIYLKMTVLEGLVRCEVSLNNKKWIPVGPDLDGKYLSTQVAGGFVGVVFGLYSYGKTEGSAHFEHARYKEIAKQEL